MEKRKKTENEKDDNIYKSENVEEMMDDDELSPKEAGFMEGYNQKQSVQGKTPKRIIQDK